MNIFVEKLVQQALDHAGDDRNQAYAEHLIDLVVAECAKLCEEVGWMSDNKRDAFIAATCAYQIKKRFQ
jgi:hypothetical protein